MGKMIIEEQTINNIPILSISQSEMKKSPLVFYVHGYGGNREQALDYGYMLAKKGFYYVSFDCKDHGLRRTDRTNNKFSPVFPPDTGLDTYIHMHEVIEQSSLDIQNPIRYFKEREEVDSDRIGISGFSMGGYATFYIAANNPDIKVAVPIAGKPAFIKAWKDSIVSTSTYEQWHEQLNKLEIEIAERTAYLQSMDPFETMSNFSPKPLLMISGDHDTDTLYTYSLELYQRLLPFYEESPGDLELWMPFVGHQFTQSMKEKAVNWFEKYL